MLNMIIIDNNVCVCVYTYINNNYSAGIELELRF